MTDRRIINNLTIPLLVVALSFAATLFSGPAFAVKVYKIVDPETGRITYTDRPPVEKNTEARPEKVELPTINTQPAVPVQNRPAKVEKKSIKYSNFAVSQPKDQSTIPPGYESIPIQLTSTPRLQPGHRVQLLFNSIQHGQPSTSMSFSITNLIRGAHNISANIIDRNGNVIASTPTITVFVKRGSLNF